MTFSMKTRSLLAGLTMATAGTAHADPITLGPVWQQFSFFEVGTEARGCFPEDPAPEALDCVPAAGGYTVLAPAPPWTFTSLTQPVILWVTDAFLNGDRFEIRDNDVVIGVTPAVAAIGGCGDDPTLCFGNAATSYGAFSLLPGDHSLTIVPLDIYDAGSAYFRVAELPEPSTFALVLGALMLLGAQRALRR